MDTEAVQALATDPHTTDRMRSGARVELGRRARVRKAAGDPITVFDANGKLLGLASPADLQRVAAPGGAK